VRWDVQRRAISSVAAVLRCGGDVPAPGRHVALSAAVTYRGASPDTTKPGP
jgi:hypothetical protein